MTKRTSVGAGIRVLMIDDSPSALDFQRMLLERYGFEVRGCASLAELSDVDAGWRPHLIVSDVDLPDACEVDVPSVIATHEVTRGVEVVLCSGLPLEELRELGRRLRVADVVSKSDNIRDLPETLRRVVAASAGTHDGSSTTRQ